MLNRNVPEVRFSGFNEKWQCRKIESVYKKVRNAFVGTATPFYVKKGNFYLQSNNVKDGRINRVTEVFINDEFYQKQKDKWLHTGDLVMVQSGHVGHTAVIEEDLDGTAAHALIMFQGYKEPTNPYFINFQFQTKDAKRKLESVTTGNTIKHILASEMKTVELNMTCLEEQNKIAKLLYILDKMIFLNQQELTTLKQTKQGFLQKMFPKEGETVPEVRFPGFSGEWDRLKLGDLSKVSMCKRIFKEQTTVNGEIPFYKIGTFGGIPDSFISREIFDDYRKKYPYPEIGDILISASGTIGRTVVYDGEEAYYQDSNIIWLDIDKDKIKNSFLQYFYAITNWSSVEGSTIKRLYNNKILSTFITLPCLDEQAEIGKLFMKLDEEISLQEQELEALKQTKQAFLQKMFV